MTDVLTKPQRSYNMSRIRAYNTKPEISLKNLLKGAKLKDYLYQPKIIGNPDFASKKLKTVIFVDGCFWHKCPKCFVEPSTRKRFWINKINKNVERDVKVNRDLKKKGWKIIRVWEHEIKKNPQRVISKINRISGLQS